MFATERHQYMRDALTRSGRVEVATLAQALEVSEDTIRRDLKVLAEQGFLQKTHGGAVLLDTAHMSYPARASVRVQAKAGIGAAAARLVEPRQTIFIDAGMTTLELARALDVQPLQVMTNSLDVAMVMTEKPGITLILTGGQWSAQERHLSGASALSTLAGYRADIAFIGACAIHPRLGVTATELADAEVKSAMLQHAASSALLADSSKFGQIAAHFVAGLDAFDHLFTDQPPDWPVGDTPALHVVP